MHTQASATSTATWWRCDAFGEMAGCRAWPELKSVASGGATMLAVGDDTSTAGRADKPSESSAVLRSGADTLNSGCNGGGVNGCAGVFADSPTSIASINSAAD